MVAARARTARGSGFLRTPGWPTRKLIWANWGAPERSNRKRDRCSVQAAAELGFLPEMGPTLGPPPSVLCSSIAAAEARETQNEAVALSLV